MDRSARRGGRAAAAAAAAAMTFAVLGALPASAKPLDPATTTSTTAGDARLQQIKSDAASQIANRVNDLNQTIATLRSTSWLGADQSVLIGTAQGDITALTQLGATIAADTTVLAAQTHAAQITAGYRVYALVIPVDHLVRASDAVADLAVPELNSLAVTINGLVTPANSAVIQPLLTDLTTQSAAAAHDVAGLPVQLEADTPAQWNTNPGLLAPPTTAVHAAREAIAQASKDAHTIIDDLTHPAAAGH